MNDDEINPLVRIAIALEKIEETLRYLPLPIMTNLYGTDPTTK